MGKLKALSRTVTWYNYGKSSCIVITLYTPLVKHKTSLIIFLLSYNIDYPVVRCRSLKKTNFEQRKRKKSMLYLAHEK